jgi:hypothetical protein
MPHRLTITNREKVAHLDEIDRRLRTGESLRAICRCLDVQPSQARRWKRLREKLMQPHKGHCASVNTGQPSMLAPIKEELLRWFNEKRDQGIMLSTRLVSLQACRLSADFRRKSTRAKDQTVRRLLASNRIVIRAVTHTGQRAPQEVVDQALDFIRDIREKVVGMNRSLKYIINMDQTPVFFDMSTGKTLSRAGKLFVLVLVTTFIIWMTTDHDNFRYHLQVLEQ